MRLSAMRRSAATRTAGSGFLEQGLELDAQPLAGGALQVAQRLDAHEGVGALAAGPDGLERRARPDGHQHADERDRGLDA